MEIIADLHLHSKYSRAVSQEMIIPQIFKWAVKKGIGLVGTGDWTHPLWLREIKANLKEVGEGVYGLKGEDAGGDEFSHPTLSSSVLPSSHSTQSKLGRGIAVSVEMSKIVTRHPLFILSTEISSIYSQGGRQRRIHNLILAPSIEVVEKINKALSVRGVNLLSDGRPILGLSASQVAELIFEISQKCLLIPAHVWTPWFSLYGSMSGFDSIDECFGNFSKNIYALETGLSSDPSMNWRIEENLGRQIVSFGDAHSPQKLGREATVFEIPGLSYENIRRAIIGKFEDGNPKLENPISDLKKQTSFQPSNHRSQISFTIEFYPEEGKYHYSGHRKCQVAYSPHDIKVKGTTCPVCGRSLTVGVTSRVEKLASIEIETESKINEKGVRFICDKEGKRTPYVMLVPLQEILAESLNLGLATKGLEETYEKMITSFGSEFEVLLKTEIEEIRKIFPEKVAEGIKRVRLGDIHIEPGFDGVFGKVCIWSGENEKKKKEEARQTALF